MRILDTGDVGDGTVWQHSALMRVLLFLLVAAVLAGVALAWRGLGGDASTGGSVPGRGPGGSGMGPLEVATNRQGRDLSQAGVRTDTASQCADLCGTNPLCKAMSFAKSVEGDGGICLLKSEVPNATENPVVTSAVKIASAPDGTR
jgi:hypothetical protein